MNMLLKSLESWEQFMNNIRATLFIYDTIYSYLDNILYVLKKKKNNNKK